METEDSGSEYDPTADGDDEDDGDLPLMIEKKGDEEEEDFGTLFEDGGDASSFLSGVRDNALS